MRFNLSLPPSFGTWHALKCFGADLRPLKELNGPMTLNIASYLTTEERGINRRSLLSVARVVDDNERLVIVIEVEKITSLSMGLFCRPT